MNRPLLRWILIGAGAVLVLFLYTWFAYRPLAQKLAEQRRMLAAKQQEIKEIEYILDHYEVFAERASRLFMERRQLTRMLPEQAEIADLLKDVTRAAAESQIQDLKFIPQPPTEEAEFARQPVRLTITCGYHGLGMFLGKLASLPRLINADGLQINGRDKTGAGDSITVDMVLETYVQKNR